jgi:hypothetical protein
MFQSHNVFKAPVAGRELNTALASDNPGLLRHRYSRESASERNWGLLALLMAITLAVGSTLLGIR